MMPAGYPIEAGGVGDYPIKVGSMLLTMVDPQRGHEIAYNRWYERDHFYAGCMIGAWNISGARFVATKDLKALRYPADSPVIPDPARRAYGTLRSASTMSTPMSGPASIPRSCRALSAPRRPARSRRSVPASRTSRRAIASPTPADRSAPTPRYASCRPTVLSRYLPASPMRRARR